MATVRCLGCMAEYEREYGICPHCGYEMGTQADSALHMQPGTILNGRYLIGRVVGYGGFGVTYIGWDETLRQRVAIKEYLPSEFATRAVGQSQVTVFGGNKAEQFAGGLTKFVEEAKRLAQFQNEPGIVRVFDSFEENNTAYIVMEYLDGETLTAYLEKVGKIPADTAIAMLTPIIRSLEEVHSAGIIHRDIAPDNIMITGDGAVKLIDFGAARYATTSHSRSLTVIIKPGFSPEEQYRSRGDQGPHTDVYALAAVLYRMVTGVTPPDALERRAFFENKKKDILVPPSKNCAIGKNTETAILNAMNVRVEDRTQTAAAFLEELTSPDPVSRRTGKIKAADMMKWPLWAKILIPVCGAAVLALFVLLVTGKISFASNLVDRFTIGEGMTRVPSVINYSIGVAQSKLEEQELTAVISGREISDVIPANMVLRQGIDAGGVVEKGTSLDLYISEAAAAAPEEGTMPDVLFYQEEEAVGILQQLGAVVNLEYEYSDDVIHGLVFYTSIGVGDPLNEGDMVTLIVSKGPDPDAVVDREDAEEGLKMKLSRSALSLFVGDAVSLTVTGHGPFSWTTSNSNVAAVKDGVVTAVGRGSATVTVSSNGETASCRVTVQDYSVSLSQTSVALFLGGSMTVTASGAPSGTSVTWSSSNDKVATVSKGKITAVSTGSAAITAQFTSNGKTYSASCQVKVTDSGITLSQYNASLYTGESITLSATTSPGGQSVRWSSSNSSVATVSSSGKVTAVGSGTAIVTASFTYGGREYFESCSVTVRRVAINLSKSSLSLSIGGNGYLSAATTPSGQSVTWSSSNDKVATVSGSGKVTAVGSGSATVTASMSYGGSTYKDTCTVSVGRPNIEISKSSVTLAVGNTEELYADVSPGSVDVSWSSSNPSVATVSGSGKVTAVGEGQATVTASMSYGGSTYKTSCTVTVVPVVKPGIKLSAGSISLSVGGTESLTAATTPSGQSVTWSSSNPSVATVSGSGKVTAVGEGRATVAASMTYEGSTYKTSCTVTVVPVVKPGIKLSAGSISLSVGGTESLTATTTPSGQSVTWSSNDTSVATIDGDGKVTAIGEGTAIIFADMWYEGHEYRGTCTVSVEPASRKIERIMLYLFPGDSTIEVGELGGVISFRVHYTNGDVEPLTTKANFYTEDPSIADVKDFRVVGVSEGETVLHAEYEDIRASMVITVIAIEPKIELSESRLELAEGESASLSASTTPGGQAVTWKTTNEGVATVSSSGRVTAVGEGSATVTASMTYDGTTYSDTCIVSVEPTEKKLGSITVNASSTTLTVGESITVTARANYQGGTSEDITDKADFYPYTSGVATCSENKVTGIAAGSVLIMAEYENFVGYVRINVKEQVLEEPDSITAGYNEGVDST